MKRLLAIKRVCWRRLLRWAGLVCLLPLLLLCLSVLLLVLPPVQRGVVRTAAGYWGEALGLELQVGEVRLGFPLTLQLRDGMALQAGDTLMRFRQMGVHVRLLPLLRGELQVASFTLAGVQIDSREWLGRVQLRGNLDRMEVGLASFGGQAEELIRLSRLHLCDGNFAVCYDDTATQEEDEAAFPWLVELDELQVDRMALSLQMVSEGYVYSGYTGNMQALAGRYDGKAERFTFDHIFWEDGRLCFDADTLVATSGLDWNHLALEQLSLQVDSCCFGKDTLAAVVRGGQMLERSGLQVEALTGRLVGYSLSLSLPDLHLQTASSSGSLSLSFPYRSWDATPEGTLQARLALSVGRPDLLLLLGDRCPVELRNSLPDTPLTVEGQVAGNSRELQLKGWQAGMRQAFSASLEGYLKMPIDTLHRQGSLRFTAETEDLSPLLQSLFADTQGRFALPAMQAAGKVALHGGTYRLDMQLNEGAGCAALQGLYTTSHDRYDLSLQIDSLDGADFLPHDSLRLLSASLHLQGAGLDLFRKQTRARLTGEVSQLRYGACEVSPIHVEGTLEDQLLQARLLSPSPLLTGHVALQAHLCPEWIDAALEVDAGHVDLEGLGIVADTLSTAFRFTAEGWTDRLRTHHLQAHLGNWQLSTPERTIRPKELTLLASSTPDTTSVSLQAGDLALQLQGQADAESLLHRFSLLGSKVVQQFDRDSTIHFDELRAELPTLSFTMYGEKDNPIYNILQRYDLSFDKIAVEAGCDAERGFSMDADLVNLMRDTTRIDTICVVMQQDSLGLNYLGRVVKQRFRKQPPFHTELKGVVRSTYADAHLHYKDGVGRTGVLIGARLSKVEDGGVSLQLLPDEPILAFRPFRLNKDNYLLYRNAKDMAADIRLTGERNASLWLHSVMAEERQVLHAELNQLDLERLSEGFPDLPALRGIFSADIEYAPTDSSFMVMADAHIDTFFYNNGRVGELMFNGVYLPLEDDLHQIDLHFFRDGEECLSGTADYVAATDTVNGTLQLLSFPFEMLNPFLPAGQGRMTGTLAGEMAFGGTVRRPLLNGSLQMDGGELYVIPLGTTFRFDNRPIEVQNNLLRLNHYQVLAAGDQPFQIDGVIDLGQLTDIQAELQLTAHEMQLLNAKRTKESLLYGKLFVNLDASVRGPLQALTMRGDLQLLGGTNVTYVMPESQLTTQDRLAGLVTFVDFSDTLLRRRRRRIEALPINGFDMLMTVRLDQAVRLNADLTPDQSNRIELEGGGDLSFQYTKQGDMLLNGRYALTGGTVKYDMPVIPLKTFDIKNGSYIQWNGNLMSPTLNLTATERVRASVSQGENSSRRVTFDVGVVIRETLENLQMNFVLTAPEDQSMQQELDKMSESQLSQIAVTMLVTGMYLDVNDLSSKKGGLNMGGALNSFLQSEISNIAGSALQSMDFTVGMEQNDGTSGNGRGTDFSFRFAKRFYNDRISIILGGRVSTGQETVTAGQNRQFIDNVSIEYRLDNSGTRYIKLFHDKNYESLLEGEITETGAGIVLRRKMLHLRELFNFRKKKVKPVSDETVNLAKP